MASSVATAAATLFTSLSARPPTPPRETNHARDAAASARPAPFDPRLSLQTPPNAGATSSAATESNTGSGRSRKKVEWSAHTQYKEPTEFKDGSAPPKPSPAASATPSSASRPIKGILKPSASPSPLVNSLNGDTNGDALQGNIIDMLDSTIKQLAGSDRDSKLDAYMMLARALKASNNLPDRVALQDKMSLFMQFIQRDITAKNSNATPDTSLINHALGLVATFLHFPAIASTLTSDFGIFIIDHAIRSFEDAPASKKDVIRHLMQVVAFQNFPPKVMTSDRVGRLVASLHKIENHLTGKSIIMSRIQIYKRLIKQAPKHMTVYSDWLQDMFTDMLSSIKEIRSQAISLGTEAGFALRSEKPLMRRATEILQETSDGEAYIAFYISRLQEMIKERQTSSAVPQIWSVVILFLRCPLERWQYYGPWLTLVQSAFNMTDSLTKHEANYAWNRYIYLSLTDNKVSPKVLGTLCQPLSSQLRRKSSPKQTEEAVKLKRIVVGGICNLYYYAFAPGNDKYPTDSVWEVTVHPIMNLLINLDGKPDIPGDCVMQASHLLVGLLDTATPRVWRHDRIMDLPPPKADELPPIDAKWVRRNCEKVLQPVSAILEKKFLDLANKESLAYRLWQVLVGSIASASAKDIKVSEDTAKFIAFTFSFIAKVWSAGVPGGDETTAAKFFAGMQNLVAVLVEGLRVLPFMEKKLSMTSNSFEPILTPSHRNDQPESPQGVSRIPVLHLSHMFSTLPPGVKDDESFSTFFSAVFEPFFKDRPRKARLELARELLHQLPRNATTPFAPWILASQNLSVLLIGSPDVPTSSITSSEQLLGPVYREFVSLLDRGLMSHPNLPLLQWTSLFTQVCEHAKSQAGDAGLALAVVEPLAKALADSILPNANTLQPQQLLMAIQASSALFEVAHMPQDAHAVEAARRRLWGTALTTAKSSSADPYDHLYKLGNNGLGLLYPATIETLRSENTILFLQSVTGFLDRSSATHGLKLLIKLQQGICVWILDEDSRLGNEADEAVFKAVQKLWDQACAIFTGNGSLSKAQFDDAEALFTTAFKSKQTYIVQKAADAWNTLVKDEDSVDCSESLKSVVSSLRLKLDIALPGSEAGDFGAQSGRGREDISFVALSSMSSHQDGQQEPDSTAGSSTPTMRRISSRKRRTEAVPETTRTKRSRPSATPKRLRHDNSQIKFAPIASSSPVVEESQHLTERQKEVRERQREENKLYSDVQNPSAITSGDEKETPKAKTKSRPKQKGTPQREEQYSKHITSTPTPRRGQFLQLDDLNDPPSSPPLPRPYPLLSELKHRSRADNSMENWEFSSPPGSPTANQTGSTEAVEVQPTALAELQQPAAGMVTRSRRRGSVSQDEPIKVIPSSLDAEDQVKEDAKAQPKQPTARSRRGKSRTSISTPTHELFEEASIETPKPKQVQKEAKAPEEVVTNETAEGSKPSRRRKSLRGKAAATEQATTFEIVIPSSAPDDVPIIPSSPAVPSTPSDKPGVDSAGGSKRKRKRKRTGLSSAGSTPRKRRSPLRELETEPELEPELIVQVNDVPAAEEESEESQSLPELKQAEENETTAGDTRKSARQQHQPVEVSPLKRRTRSRSRVKNKRSSTVPERPKEGGDTDEEVMSQLFMEATAATSSQPKVEAVETTVAAPETSAPGTFELVNDPAPEQATKLSIMDTLRQGLDQLRTTTLSRDEVYKMEEMLMDMKREIYEAEFRGRKSE